MNSVSRSKLTLVALVLGLMVTCALASAQDLVDNPQYVSWAKQKPGSAVTYSMNNSAGGQQMTGTVVHKLVEVTADQVTVEMTTNMQVNGQSHAGPPMKATYKAKVPAADADQSKLPQNVKGTAKEVGNEKVDAAGKSFDCKVIEYEGTMGAPPHPPIKGKIWRSAEVPGGVVKMQSEMQQGAMTMKVGMILQSMDLK